MPGTESWEPMSVTSAGDVGRVLQLGEGKLSTASQPDNGMETPQSAPGQE